MNVADGFTRLRIDLAYDGTNYSGWAKQLSQTTVQGELEAALAVVLRLPAPPPTFVAGRTDAGVHARAQVVHLDVPTTALVVSWDRLAFQLRGILPNDVVVRSVSAAPAGFDARFSALWRAYEYTIDDRCAGANPLTRTSVFEHFRHLDEHRMNEASAMLLGVHDFTAFCKPREWATTVRTLQQLQWTRTDEGLLRARVQADAFCHSMVRFLVGALMTVGEGTRPIGWPAGMLTTRVREQGFNLAAAQGLVLVEVRYPEDELLAQRAIQTRAMREEFADEDGVDFSDID
jgi:tRNA pseudouridine38-40 synthase